VGARVATERGAILLLVAIAVFVLTALSAFVLDYGVLWLSRRQAQNAADAGALAGAIARAWDETADPPTANGPAFQAATKAAQANDVFGAVPGTAVSWDCPPFVTGGGCVRVDVFRDGTNGSTTLPVYFAPLLGVTSQRMRATATAQARPANATDCLRPWAVPDKWIENRPVSGPWTPTSTYDHYVMNGSGAGQSLPDPIDVYVAPTASDPGTGFTLPADLGTEMTLKFSLGNNGISPGWYQPVDVPRADGAPEQGGERYRDNIAGCNGLPVSIGDYLPTESGAKIGPTVQGMDALIAQDPNAQWNAATDSVDNSCAPECAPISPRVVALAVFDTDAFQYSDATNDWSMCPTGGSCVRVVNFLGFFVDQMQGNDVIGYLVRYPGILSNKPTGVSAPSAFAVVITLVR
jgi:Flp pilus assembly protein TadG